MPFTTVNVTSGSGRGNIEISVATSKKSQAVQKGSDEGKNGTQSEGASERVMGVEKRFVSSKPPSHIVGRVRSLLPLSQLCVGHGSPPRGQRVPRLANARQPLPGSLLGGRAGGHQVGVAGTLPRLDGGRGPGDGGNGIQPRTSRELLHENE